VNRVHTLDEVAEAHHVTPRWLATQIRAGRIRAIKLGRRWVMTDEHVADMLAAFSSERRASARVADADPAAPVALSAASTRRRRTA